MNLQRRRQVAEAADKVDLIIKTQREAEAIIAQALKEEVLYRDNILLPLQNSSRATDAVQAITQLEVALKNVQALNLMPASHALVAAMESYGQPDFGAVREGLRSAAEKALETLQSGGRKAREVAIHELEAALH